MASTWLLLAWALGATEIDPASRVEFTLHTRWGQTLHGRFPAVEGRVEVDADHRRRTYFKLDASLVEIIGSPRYSRFARGPRFFDAERYPEVEFTSDPYPAALLRDGGALAANCACAASAASASVAPSTCERPGLDCDIVVHGTVRRSKYGLDSWQMALRESVVFTLRVRLASCRRDRAGRRRCCGAACCCGWCWPARLRHAVAGAARARQRGWRRGASSSDDCGRPTAARKPRRCASWAMRRTPLRRRRRQRRGTTC